MGKPKTTTERQTARRKKLKNDAAAYKAFLEKDRFRKTEQIKKTMKKMSQKEHEEYKIKERIRIRNSGKKKQQHHQLK